MWIRFIVEGLRWRCIGNGFIVEGLQRRCIGNGFTVEGLRQRRGVRRLVGRWMRDTARVYHVGDLDSKFSKMDSTTTGKSSTSSRSACGGSTASSSGGVGGFWYWFRGRGVMMRTKFLQLCGKNGRLWRTVEQRGLWSWGPCWGKTKKTKGKKVFFRILTYVFKL